MALPPPPARHSTYAATGHVTAKFPAMCGTHPAAGLPRCSSISPPSTRPPQRPRARSRRDPILPSYLPTFPPMRSCSLRHLLPAVALASGVFPPRSRQPSGLVAGSAMASPPPHCRSCIHLHVVPLLPPKLLCAAYYDTYIRHEVKQADHRPAEESLETSTFTTSRGGLTSGNWRRRPPRTGESSLFVSAVPAAGGGRASSKSNSRVESTAPQGMWNDDGQTLCFGCQVLASFDPRKDWLPW